MNERKTKSISGRRWRARSIPGRRREDKLKIQMQYQIRYCYDTGDSNSSQQNCSDTLPNTWCKLDIAVENLNRIKEHYQFYLSENNYHFNNEKLDFNPKEKDWYVEQNPEFRIILYTDEGKPVQIKAPWCGYFETLNFAEIVMKLPRVTFND